MALDQLSLTFAALADPTRRAILARLVTGECSVTELAEPFDMSLPGVSKHLRVLERAGLIARARVADVLRCHVDAPLLKEVHASAVRSHDLFEARLDRVDSHLEQLAPKKEKRHGRQQPHQQR